MDCYQKARELIDIAHAADPKRTDNGCAAELVYADNMERWVAQVAPEATPALRLAARCQHLERWAVPRASFPLDKPGYHAWRKSLYKKQADRARELLLQANVPTAEADEVATWVSKTGLKTNPGTQALEDAACLVFLDTEIPGFATLHPDYTREKYVDIIRKTWRKMSPRAHELAHTIALPPDVAALVKEAIAG
jgi:tRNAThr (cytosine32-N3)-methyltransferase